MAAALAHALARAGYASSIVSNENSAIFCTLLPERQRAPPAG